MRRPELLTQAARRFGSQCVVASIDALRTGAGWEVYINGGRQPTGLGAVEWVVVVGEAAQAAALLRGEQVAALSLYDTQYALVESAGQPVRMLDSGPVARTEGAEAAA